MMFLKEDLLVEVELSASTFSSGILFFCLHLKCYLKILSSWSFFYSVDLIEEPFNLNELIMNTIRIL